MPIKRNKKLQRKERARRAIIILKKKQPRETECFTCFQEHKLGQCGREPVAHGNQKTTRGSGETASGKCRWMLSPSVGGFGVFLNFPELMHNLQATSYNLALSYNDNYYTNIAKS